MLHIYTPKYESAFNVRTFLNGWEHSEKEFTACKAESGSSVNKYCFKLKNVETSHF